MIIADADAMERFGAELARVCEQPLSIYLSGELGTGKTTLVRGFLRALGHRGAVSSPTYTLVEPYSLIDRLIYHFDLYRLTDPEELDYLGARDYLDGQSVCLVEWPERGGNRLPEPDIRIAIEYAHPGRALDLVPISPQGKGAIGAIDLTSFSR